MIKLYYCNIKDLSDTNYYEQGFSKLSPDRRSKIAKITPPMDKIRSMGAGLLLDYCLKLEGIETYSIETRNHGKPYLNGMKIPNGMYIPFFNLSHSENFVLCGISDREIGVDIQLKKTDGKSSKWIDSIITKHFTAEEQSFIKESLAEKKLELFYQIWTGKESYMKMTGKGFSKGLNTFVVKLENKEVCDLEELKTYPIWNIQITEMVQHYLIAVCSEVKEADISLSNITIEQILYD